MCSPAGLHLRGVADLSLGLRSISAGSEALEAQVTDRELRPAGRPRLEGLPRRGAPPGLGSRRTWRRRRLRRRGVEATSSACSSRGPGLRPVSPSPQQVHGTASRASSSRGPGLRPVSPSLQEDFWQQRQRQQQRVRPGPGREERRRHLLQAVDDGDANVLDIVYEAIRDCGTGGGHRNSRGDGDMGGVHLRRLPARTGLPYWMVQDALRDWIGIGVMKRDRGRIRLTP